MPQNRASQSNSPPTRRGRAEAAVRRTRTDIARMSAEEIQRTVHELQARQIELEMQNEELRIAQTELSQSRDRFNDLYDSAPVGYLTLDAVGTVIEANLTVARMLGLERGKLVGRKFARFVARGAQDTLHFHQRAVLGANTKQTCELLLRGLEGTTFFVRMESIGFAEPATGTRQCRSAIIDITEQKEAAQAFARSHADLEQRVAERTEELRESERTARAVVDGLTAHIAITDEHGCILAVNVRWREFAKKNGGSLMAVGEGANYLAVCDAAARRKSPGAEEVAAGIRDVLAGKTPEFGLEYPCHSPTEERWFIVRVTPFPGEGPRRVVIAHHNITARVQAELAVRREKEFSDHVIDTVQTIVLLLSPQGRILQFNRHLEELSGWTLEEVRGRSWFETFLPARDRARVRKLFQKAIGGEHTQGNINSILTRDGRELEIEWHDALFRKPDGHLVGLLCSGRDITRRRLAEVALQESERRERERAEELSALLDSVPAAIFFAHDRDCRRITGNRAADELLQLPRGAEASLSAPGATRPRHFRVLHNGRIVRSHELPAQRAARGFPVSDFEETIVFDDGTSRDMLAYATPLWDEAGQSRGAILVLIDITARKRAEAALRESEERYRQLVHALPAAVYTVDAQGRITLYNAAAVALWGREPTPRDRWNGARRLFTPDGKRLPFSQTPIAMSVRQDEPIRERELIIERPDRSRSHVLAFPDPIHDSSGAVIGAVNMLVDITALKRAENALRTSERSLRTLSRAVEQSPASVLITNTRGEIDYVNPKFTEVSGYSLAEVLGKNPRLLKSNHQPAGLYREMWKTINAGQVWRSELCNRKKNGERFWVHAVIAPIQDEDGTITHFVELMEDITERKRTEKALAESKHRFAGIVGSAMDAIISVDARQRIVLFNAAAETMFRCPAIKALGGSLEQFIPPRFHAAHARYLQRFGKTSVTSRAMGSMGATTALRADGEEFPIEASISQIEVGGQKLFTVILRDITERKQLEREVLEISAREQRRIGQELHDDLCQWLAGTEFSASALAKDLARESPAHAPRALKIAEGMRQSLARARTLARGLAPTVIESEGLARALRELAANASKMFVIRCFYDGPETLRLRDEVAALHLYRIAQEAITNAVRHGRAREVGIFLQPRKAGVSMLIRDNGSGLPKRLAPSTGMGLRTMRYRAGIIGATLEIRSHAGGGAELVCNFPKEL